MKKLLKNKRGIAMESAVLFMLVMFMLGFLLTGIAMTAHLRVKVNNSILSREMEIEQIGEYFLHSTEQTCTDYINGLNGNYTYEIQNNTLTLKRNNKVVLYIDKANNIWKYSIEDN